MPSPNYSAYTIQTLSFFTDNVWKFDVLDGCNLAPADRTEVGTTESTHSSYSGPQFNMNPYYGMTQKNGKLYGFAGENNTPVYQWPGQIFEIDQDWEGRTKTIYSGLTGVLPFGFNVCNVGGFAYDKGNDCFTLLRGTTEIGVPPPPPPLLPTWPNGERYLHTWGVSHPAATPQLPFYSGVTCLLETVLGLAYRNSELYAVAYISGNTPGLTFQHINTNSGINTILSYCPLSVDSVINSVVSVQGWTGDLTYDEVGDNFYFLSHNGTAKIDPQFYTWETVPSTATTQQFYGGASSFQIFGFEIMEPESPVVTTTTTLCTEIYSVEVNSDFTNATISLCDADCINCEIMYISGCTAPHFGWCTATTTCFDLTLECCKTYCVQVEAPDGCSYTEYITAECPSTTTTTYSPPPPPATTTTTTQCVCVNPVEYFNGTLSGVTYPGDTLEGTYCNDNISPFIYNHIGNISNSILTHGILIKQNPWGSLPISNNWWSLIRDIGSNNYLLVGTGSTLTSVYTGIPPLANNFLVLSGDCECPTDTTTTTDSGGGGTTTTTLNPAFTTTTTLNPNFTTTTTLNPNFTTTTTTTLHPCDFGPVPLTGDCPTTTTTTVPPTTTTTTPDPCDFGTIILTGDCVTSTTTPNPYFTTTTTTTVPCCDECCLITGAWEIINTGTTGNNGFYSIHKTSPHNQTNLPIALKDPLLWGAIPHMFFQGFAKRTTNNFLYGAFLEHKVDDTCNNISRYDLHIYQVNPNTGSGSLAQTYTGYDLCNNTSGIRTDELGEGCLGYDSLNDKLIFVPYNNTVHPVYQIQPWVNGSVTYLGDWTVLGSPPNPYAHMSGLSNVPGTNSFYCYLDECSFTPTPPGGTVNCNSIGGYVCGFDTTTLNSSILPGTINPLLNNSISAGLLYDCNDLYIVRQLPSCSGGTPQQYTNTWIDKALNISGECAFRCEGSLCCPGTQGVTIGAESLKIALNVFDKDGNFVSMDMLTGDTTNPLTLTVYDPFTTTTLGQWQYNIYMDGSYPGVPPCVNPQPSPCPEHMSCSGNKDWYMSGIPQCGSVPNSPPGNCVNVLYLENPANVGTGISIPEPSLYEITLEFGGMGTPCSPEYADAWQDDVWTATKSLSFGGIYDVGVGGNLPGVGSIQDQRIGDEYMVLNINMMGRSGQVYNGHDFTASTKPWKFNVRDSVTSAITNSWEYELVRYPTGPGFPCPLKMAVPPVNCLAYCQGSPDVDVAGAMGQAQAGDGIHYPYRLWFKNPNPSGNVVLLTTPASSLDVFEIEWGETVCCSGATDNLVLTKYTLPSGPITNTILGTISGVTSLAGLECAGNICETPDNPCPTTTTTTVPVSTTTTTDPCATTTTTENPQVTTTTTIGPPTTTTTTFIPTTTTTTLLVGCECECPPTPEPQCPCIFSGTNFYVFYDGSASFAVSANQIANNVVLPWWQQFIQTLPGYVGCLYQATIPPPQQQSESWLRFSEYPWEGTNSFTPTPIGVAVPLGVCGTGIDMPIAPAINDPNAVVISFVNEAAPWYNDNPWNPLCNTPQGTGVITPPLPCTDWNTNQANSFNVTSGLQKVVPTLNYLQDFDSFMTTYHNGVWDKEYGTPGNNGSFNSFVYTLPVSNTLEERVTELNAYGAVEGRVVPAIDFVDIGPANSSGGLYKFDAIKQTNPYCADACFWDSGYGPGKTPDGRCMSGLTHFGFISVHSHEYLLSSWLGSQQNNNIGIATLSATVCFNTACTSGITIEECCITGLTAQQWVVDNPNSVNGFAIGQTFEDNDHLACFKVIPPPVPLPSVGITLNPGVTFGIDDCANCLSTMRYCEPTTTTTTYIWDPTTTTSTTVRQIWGVERCCCPTGETKTISNEDFLDAATPINFNYLTKPIATLGDYVYLNNFTPQGGFAITTTTTTAYNGPPIDITLHMFDKCPGAALPDTDSGLMAPVWADSTIGFMPDQYPALSPLLAVKSFRDNNAAFYSYIGSPTVGDTVKIRHTLHTIANGTTTDYDYEVCMEYIGTQTFTFPSDPMFNIVTCVVNGSATTIKLYCQYWLCFIGDSPLGTFMPGWSSTLTLQSTHLNCATCNGGVSVRTFHIWEECVENAYLPLSTSFPPGMCITNEGLPGAIVTGPADYNSAAGLDDVEFNSNIFYNFVGAPNVGEVVTIQEATQTFFNDDVFCLRYMGTVTTSVVPWTQPGWHMSALVVWSYDPDLGTNSECCVCTDLQDNAWLGQSQGSGTTPPQLPRPGYIDMLGNTLRGGNNDRNPISEPKIVVFEPTIGAKILNGWEDINVNGSAYLARVWTKNGDQCVSATDTRSCAYIDRKAFVFGGPLSNFVGDSLEGTADNQPRVGDFINLYHDNAYGLQSIEILDIVDQVMYQSDEVRCSGQRLIISNDIRSIPLLARFRNCESSLSQSPIVTTTTSTIVIFPPAHLFQTCWLEQDDYAPTFMAASGVYSTDWGIEWYASPGHIGQPCYPPPFTTVSPTPDFTHNNQKFYEYMGSPNVGETVRWTWWSTVADFENYQGLGPSRVPGQVSACLKYLGWGQPQTYSYIHCQVPPPPATCSYCDSTFTWGGDLATRGVVWDTYVTNLGLNHCCCTNEPPNNNPTGSESSCMPKRIFRNPCSGFTHTDLSAIPIGGTWYDATSGECFTHIADPGLTYFDFTAPVPNPGGPYLDCEDCHDMNEIICDPTTTTTTRPREVWGIKPCCCDERDMIGTVPNIGDTGEAGGIIFHVDTINNTIYEVAPKALEIGGPLMKWGCSGTAVLTNPTLGTSLGMGKTNTNEIFATTCSDPCPWKAYLQSLTVLAPSGIQYNDWFAPSYGEWIKLWFNVGPGQSITSPLYNIADIDPTVGYDDLINGTGVGNGVYGNWITSSEDPNNPHLNTINIGHPVAGYIPWYTQMGSLPKSTTDFENNGSGQWLRPIRSYNYETCSGYTTTDLSTIPIGSTWFDTLSGTCYERIAYPGPTNYNVNTPVTGPYEDCECCEITHGIVSGCVTTTTTIWDPPKTTTTTTNRPTTTTTTRPAECYGIKPCCCITGETFTIGSTGPGGGVVFYHDGDGNYLEMAPYDINVSNYNLPQNIIAANAIDSAHTYTMWGCMNLPVSGTSRELFGGKENTLRINNACTPNTYGYPCCPSCTTDVNWIQTNPCSGYTVPFTYDCVTIPGEGDLASTLDCTKKYIGTNEWPNPGSNLDASNITLHSAAHICSTFSYSGYSDWYLPTIKEMNEMYNNLVGATGGQTLGLANPLVAGPPNETFYSTYNFAEGGYYWTSSECDASRVEYFPMFNGFNNMYLALGISDGPNYPTGNPCSGKDSIFPELFAPNLHSKSLIPYPDINNNVIQGSPKYVRPVRKFTSTGRYCSGCTKTDISFIPFGVVFYDTVTNMCWERIAIPGPDLYNISAVPTLFYDTCSSGKVGCLDVHNIVCTTTTVPPATTTTTSWSPTTTTTTAAYGTTTTTTTCQGISACCTTDTTLVFARWCGDSNNPASALSTYNAFYDTLTNECWETIDLEIGPVISLNYPPIPLYSCNACEIPCTTTTTQTCRPLSLSACCEDYIFTLTADCNTVTSYPMDQTDILEGQGLYGTINGVTDCYVVVPPQAGAPVFVPAGFQYSFWCDDTVTVGDPPCKCSGCTDTTLIWTGGTAYPCDPTTTTTTQRCENCICLSGISHLEIYYTGQTTSDLDDVCLTSADGTYCFEEITTQAPGGTQVSWKYLNQNNCPELGYYQIWPFQYQGPPWEITSWVLQWCDTPSCQGDYLQYQIATASTITNMPLPPPPPPYYPSWDLGQTVWEYIDNTVGPVSVNPRNVDETNPCYNYSGTSHTGCCTTYGLLTCCYDPSNPYWGEQLCCNKNQAMFNTVYDIPTLVSGTTGMSIIPINTIHTECANMCLSIVDEDIHTYPPVDCAPMLSLNDIDNLWTTDDYGCLICENIYNPCTCDPTTTTTTVQATTTTTTGPVTTTTTSMGPLGLQDCCDPTFQYVAAGALYTTLAGMNVGDAFWGTIIPSDNTGCWEIINNPVGIVQTNMSSPSFVSSSCAALNTATNYSLCCPVTTTTTIPPHTTTTTTVGPTFGVKGCCPPYDEYLATGVILSWLQSNLNIGDVVYGTVVTAPFSLQLGCWEYIANPTPPLVSVSIMPTTTYDQQTYQDPCEICTTYNELAVCTTTTTSPGTIGIEACCPDPGTGLFEQYVAAGAFETYLNGLTIGQAFQITFVVPGVGDVNGCYRIISNPSGLVVSTFVTPTTIHQDCYHLDASLNFTCCEPATTTTTTQPDILIIQHCCTGENYELVGNAGALMSVGSLNNGDTFKLVAIGGGTQFDGMACCFHKCNNCLPLAVPPQITGVFSFPVWQGPVPQCDACYANGQSDGCCPTTTTTTMRRDGLGLESCCPDPVTGLFVQYVVTGTLATDILALTLGTAHLFVLNGDPVCARVINNPVGLTVTGSVLLQPQQDKNCQGLQLWLPNQNQDPTLRIPCCPVTTTTTCCDC